MNTRDFVFLAFKAFGGKLQGKTAIQKKLYFLGFLTGMSEHLGYLAHYYGPYSAEVSDAIGEMKSLGFLEESVAGFGFNRTGFEVCRYDYKLKPDGQHIANRKAKEYSDDWEKIQSTAKLIQEASKQVDYMELSIAAKAFYLLTERGGEASDKDIVKLAPSFGWSIKPAEIQKAYKFLEKLKLVTIKE